MDFTPWTLEGRDTARRKRLAVGYGIGILIIGSTVAAVAMTAGAAAMEQEEDPLTVALVSEPEPEPEPEPVIEEKKAEPEKKKPIQQLRPPTEIPTDKPAEAQPTKDEGPAEDPYAKSQTQEVEAKPAVVEAPKPAPPPPKPKPVAPRGPIRVTENVTPPAPISQTAPGYPAEAKAAGIEGTVIIKYVVSERGDVTSAELVKGPPELSAVCLAAVKKWRFQPAVLEGRAVSVYRIARFPFRIRT